MYEEEYWRVKTWKGLVASARSRSLRSGLIQVVADILARLARHGVLTRSDAVEYLANSREAWTVDEEPSSSEQVAEEPLSHLVEKLDATVFGLIDALDADAPDLPKLLDEALRGSLWARQINREPDDVQKAHRMILETRASLIWKHSSAESRKGHFAMGVGLDTGLVLDSLADELNKFIDRADVAALAGQKNKLAIALVELAKRLLVIRPFTPDSLYEFPNGWENLLAAWVSGAGVQVIGSENMRFAEEAFAYRLVWALEALRTRRLALGWSPDTIAGGGAAALETGVPQFMMSMLVRAGLPSRQAAIHAIRGSGAAFVDGAGMRDWLASQEVANLTLNTAWPTTETSELWRRFRDETLAKEGSKWKAESSKRVVLGSVKDADLKPGAYRLEIDESTRDVWVCTPDYRRVAMLKSKLRRNPLLFSAAYKNEDDARFSVLQYGSARPIWYERER